MDYKEHLERIINKLGDSIFVKDRQHRFVFVNTHCCLVKGKTPAEILGKTDYDFWPKEEADVFWKTDEKVFQIGERNINEEVQTLFDGTKTTILTVKDLYTDSEGNQFIIGSSRDISLLKEAENKLQKYNEKLESTVKQRTSELQKANTSLIKRLEQMNFLNKKAYFFNQLISRDSLLPAIFYAFVERFPNSEIHFSELTQTGYQMIHATQKLHSQQMNTYCIQAVQHLEPKGPDDIFIERCWVDNSFLKDTFDDTLSDLPFYVVIPMASEGKIQGAVQIFSTVEDMNFIEEEKTFLSTFASQATVSMVNASLYEELADKARLKSEIEIARTIQRRFIPKEPEIPGYQLKGLCIPAFEVGGDYLDYFQNEKGDWVLVIADVCGKGVPAALVMTSLRSSVRSESRRCSSSKEILCAVNRFMQEDLQADNSFITCSCIVLEHNTDRFNYTRAGHPPLILYGKSAEPVVKVPKGIAIGMVPKGQFGNFLEQIEFTLEKGEKLVAYTDGVDESQNPEKDTYGQKRVLNTLKLCKDCSGKETVHQILKDIATFCRGQRQYDDLTMFVLEKK